MPKPKTEKELLEFGRKIVDARWRDRMRPYYERRSPDLLDGYYRKSYAEPDGPITQFEYPRFFVQWQEAVAAISGLFRRYLWADVKS